MGEILRHLEDRTVLVADGDAADRALMTALLERIGYTIHQAADGIAALALAQSTRPDAVIVDVSLPDINGYEVCHELRESFGDALPVILISGTAVETLDRVAGFLIGADEYIEKPFEPDDLLVRVRSLLRRSGHRAGEGNGGGQVRVDDALTPREREVLVLLASGMNQSEIARQLVVTPKTVATHIQRVLAKLGVHSRAEAVAYAHRHGLTDEAEVRDFEAHSLAFGPDAVPLGAIPRS